MAAAGLALMALVGPAAPRTQASPDALLVGRWQPLAAPPANVIPSNLVYDPAQGQLLAVAQVIIPGPHISTETAVFQNGVWHYAVGPVTTDGQFFFDPALGVVAHLSSGSHCLETWDGSAWSGFTCVPVGGATFVARAAAYDGTRQALIVTGDKETCSPTACSFVDSETWTWNGTTWTRLSPHHEPGPPLGLLGNPGGAAVWDAGRRVDVLVDEYGETWTWNGSDWTRRLALCSPCAVDGTAGNTESLTYDPSTGTDVMWDPMTGRIERWNGVAWLPVVTTGAGTTTGPVAFDPSLGGLVMIGEQNAVTASLWVLENGI